jgi:hypothetical protein
MKNMHGWWNILNIYSVFSTSAFDYPWAAAVFQSGPQQNKVDWEKFVTIPLHNIARTSWLLSVTQNNFLLEIIYLEATYCNSRTLVPQDVLSLSKHTIYFSRLMYSPVLYSYVMSNVTFLTSCSLLTGKFHRIEHWSQKNIWRTGQASGIRLLGDVEWFLEQYPNCLAPWNLRKYKTSLCFNIELCSDKAVLAG